MATKEVRSPADQEGAVGVLDKPLAALWSWDWEKTAWLVLLLVAAISRFADLGARSMSHDESEHAWFAYNLYSGAGYQHSPVYHGPFVYHVLALFFLIFGDSTVMARVPTALFGLGAILLIWSMRRWLGKLGAFFAATLVTLSPAILQYSRHTRHDIYAIFWALLFIVAVFSYLERGQQQGRRWLYVAAAAFSLMLAVKEVSFIYAATIGFFLLLILAYRWVVGEPADVGSGESAQAAQAGPQAARKRKAHKGAMPLQQPSLSLARGRELPLWMSQRDWLLVPAVVVLSFLGALLFKALNLATVPYDPSGVAGAMQSGLRLLPALVTPVAAVALVGWHLKQEQERGAARPLFSAAMDLVIILGTLILPWLSPFVIAALGYDPLNYNFPSGVLPSLSVLIGMAALAIAIGVLWDGRRWLTAAGIFYGIFLVFFTTFFTNGQGIATGLVGSLGYWLSQQEVARGGQPWYYYLIIVPLYEFLPILLSLLVVGRAVVRRSLWGLLGLPLVLLSAIGWILVQGALRAGDAGVLLKAANVGLALATVGLSLLLAGWGGLEQHRRRQEYLLAFLPFWILASWFAYSMAGEKMPWLTTHITLPMCIAGGWWLGRVAERVDWRAVWRQGGYWIAVLLVPLLAALAALISSRPFQDRTLAGLSETTQWLAALVSLLVVLGLLIRQSQRLGWAQGGRVAGLTLALLLGLWTVRTSYMLNFINYDYTTEFLFYAHASPDPARVMREIERMSRRTVGDKQMKVAYDDDASWPFNWYLRDWPNAAYFGDQPSREALDAPVVIAGSKNLDKVRPFLKRDYYEFSYRLIWWPDEGYKNTSWEKIRRGITDPVKRKEFLDVLIWRKYPTPPAQWPLVHRFSLFVRKDLADQLWDFGTQPVTAAPEVDVYEQGFRELSAIRVIGGGPGAAPGQLNLPRNVAVAGDGTVYVADSGNHRVQVFAADGTFLFGWGSHCELYTEGRPGCLDPDGPGPLQTGDGQFAEPWGIAVAADGTVYVADTWNHRIQVFDSQGQFLRKWGTFLATNGEAIGSPAGFWGPRGIAIDAAGNLYVTDTGNKRIQVFDKDGNFLGQFGGFGVDPGRFDEPVGIAIVPLADGSPGGRLVVADTWNRRVQELDVTYNAGRPEASFVREWPIEGWSSTSVVNKPFLAVDTSRSLIYLTDPENWRVLVFTLDGAFQATFGLYGQDLLGFGLPNGIALDAMGNVYVADADNHRVMVFPPVGP